MTIPGAVSTPPSYPVKPLLHDSGLVHPNAGLPAPLRLVTNYWLTSGLQAAILLGEFAIGALLVVLARRRRAEGHAQPAKPS